MLPCFIFLLSISVAYGRASNKSINFMTTPELLTYWGYKCETHAVITEDNYILTMHRIPKSGSKYPPILIQHGIMLASDTWLLRGPGEDLALLLSDEGFDVWLANTRGNFYSKRHTFYKNTSKKFWDFGWHELGLYDIPAMINYVLKITARPKIVHMGHSMGTTSFYAMLATKPEMNEKVYAHVSLAPVAYMSRMKSLDVISPFVGIIDELIEMYHALRFYTLLDRRMELSQFISQLCKSPKNKILCYRILFYFIGSDFGQVKKEYFDRYAGHFPSGASGGMFVHYAQNIVSGLFQELDYGRKNNLLKYGQMNAPLYNLRNVKVPIYLYYSGNDYLSHNLDVEKLSSQLPNVKKKRFIPFKYFNHMDYIWAKDSKSMLYDDIISELKLFVLTRPANYCIPGIK